MWKELEKKVMSVRIHKQLILGTTMDNVFMLTKTGGIKLLF
jgi:hypothetical protein